jgi:phage repressor protein C with HTH and peptisase S24 domain
MVALFTHQQVWDGIDRLAHEKGWSASKLAKEAGLDPTTFNKSKRHSNQAKPRWPSTESLAKILEATGTSFEHFVTLMTDRPMNGERGGDYRLKCIPIDDLAGRDIFDSTGFPIGDGWDEIDFPGALGQHSYAIEIRGDRFLPTYRDGDFLVISPEANVRRHDRVLLMRRAGEVDLGRLIRRTAQRIELERFDQERSTTAVTVQEVAWLSRILWASQ